MDFGFDEKQLAVQEEIRRFAAQELNQDLIKRDAEATFPRENWNKCADFGIQGMPFPAEYGGSENDIITSTLAMEALGYGCRDSGLIFGINAQMWSVQMPILEFGSAEQKQKYLPKLCSGEWIGGHGMSEPNSGSDAFKLSSTAVRRGNSYVLNGSKTFVSNAPDADMFVLFATVNKDAGFMGVTGFVVDRDTPGLRVGPEIGKMGLRTCPMAEVFMEDCEVPEGSRLGPEGAGASIFKSSMEWERACILASNLGSMERQLETCIRYAKERRQFGKPIGKFQSVANRIVDMKVRMETARLILYRVAWSKDRKKAATMDAAIAKLYLSDCWVQSCQDAIQIHGGYGYTTDFEVERDLRDAVGGRLYSGTSDIQRNIIAACLGL